MNSDQNNGQPNLLENDLNHENINNEISKVYSFGRFKAIMIKEFIQMRRDKLTLAMMMIIPLIQLILFGYAINSNPQHLPTAVVSADNSPLTRSIIQSVKNTGYFDIKPEPVDEATGALLLKRGEIQFVMTIPVDFTRKLLRNESPAILMQADATDPAATGNALGSLTTINQTALSLDLERGLSYLLPPSSYSLFPTTLSTYPYTTAQAPFEFVVHRVYNPEINTQYNVVPGLMGVILTMTMIMMTGLALARERERGTLENLLATPAQPLEVMFGKIIPFIVVAYIQVTIVLLAAKFLFQVPMEGSLFLLLCCVLVFAASNLAVGIMFSTIARNQMQAMQMTYFFFLPSLLLSGFMFPYRGMPGWAQVLGEIFPLTHFLRIIRGILLKGNGLIDIYPQIFWQLAFMLTVILLGLKRYKRTLD